MPIISGAAICCRQLGRVSDFILWTQRGDRGEGKPIVWRARQPQALGRGYNVIERRYL